MLRWHPFWPTKPRCDLAVQGCLWHQALCDVHERGEPFLVRRQGRCCSIGGVPCPHSCANPLALDLHTGTTIRVIVQELAAAAPELSKAQMDEKTSRLQLS